MAPAFSPCSWVSAAPLIPTRRGGMALALIGVRAISAAAVSCSRLPRIVPPASLEEGGELPAGPSHRESIKGGCFTNTLTLQGGASGVGGLPVLPVAAFTEY